MGDVDVRMLILYATKYGAAEEIAKRIAENTSNAEIHNLKQNDIPKLSAFDCVIIGSSLYAGMIRKEAKAFLSKNADELHKIASCEKKVGLFLSGIDVDPEKEKTYFETNFSSDLLQLAKVKTFLGGIYDPKKAGFAERFIYKLATKQSTYADKIDNDKIVQFAKDMERENK